MKHKKHGKVKIKNSKLMCLGDKLTDPSYWLSVSGIPLIPFETFYLQWNYEACGLLKNPVESEKDKDNKTKSI